MLARIRKSVEEKDSGFTLVELLVVMIIIGVLAAIAIPVFANQRKKAVDTGIKSDLRSVAQEVETFFVDNQTYPVSTGTADSAATKTLLGASTMNLTSGNVIRYKGTATGYCIWGYNDKGTASSDSLVFQFDSAAGGLRAGAAAAKSGGCA